MKQEDKPALFKIYTKATISTHTIFLSDEILSENERYFELLDFLTNASKDDIINFQLACRGGDCRMGLHLAHAIKNCKSTVNVKIMAMCASMTCFLALAGDSLEFMPATLLKFHNYSGWVYGKGREGVDDANEYAGHWRTVMNYFITPFLSVDECDYLATDRDIYVHASDASLSERIERHFKPNTEKDNRPPISPPPSTEPDTKVI